MPNTVQEFLADATQKAATVLEAAFLNLPEDKRAWSSADSARTALDQMAECALLCGNTADLIESRQWPETFSFEEYARDKAALAQNWDSVKPLLDKNVAKAAAVIRAFPDEDLEISVDMPWGPMTLAQIMTYPHWNMSYHLGQINYIASILGCLE